MKIALLEHYCNEDTLSELKACFPVDYLRQKPDKLIHVVAEVSVLAFKYVQFICHHLWKWITWQRAIPRNTFRSNDDFSMKIVFLCKLQSKYS